MKMNNWIEIKDFGAPELDLYARLSEVQLLRYYEPKPGLFIAESLLAGRGDKQASQTIADCDYTVKIPMSHEVDSLNEPWE